MICSKCGNEVAEGKKFCGKCGNPMGAAAPASAGSVICSKCGAPVTHGKKFCGKCGTPVVSTPSTGSGTAEIDGKSAEMVQSAGFIHWNILPGQLAVKID